MTRYSSKCVPPFALALGFGDQGAELLSDFVNTRPEDFERFESKWYKKLGLIWYEGSGRERGVRSFSQIQHEVREIWEGKHKGYERQLIEEGLSMLMPRQEEGWWDSTQQLFHVDWESGFIWASPCDLGDGVWVSLLQNSQRLTVCANKGDGCPAPYFLRKKPNQKFCSEVCAAPAQREFKREWFRKHGEQWRKEWLKKRRSSKKLKKGRNSK